MFPQKLQPTRKTEAEKYVRPMAGQLAARCFLHNMQQFVARPDVYNKINNISRTRLQFPSIYVKIKLRFEFLAHNLLQFCLLWLRFESKGLIKVASEFII